jgi:undecaprenyl-diphosphatase
MRASGPRQWLAWVRQRSWWRPELPVLLALLSAALLAWGFIELADEVAGGETQSVDERVVDALRNPDDPRLPRGPRWLADGARDITALGSTVVLTLVVAFSAGYLLLLGRTRGAALLVAAVLSGVLLSSTLKSSYNRTRPPEGSALQGTQTASFPSGHSFSSAVVYLTLGAMLARFARTRRLRVYFIVVALLLPLLIGLSRVYLGVHYPSDVLAGWAAGAAWALWWWVIARFVWPDDPEAAASV